MTARKDDIKLNRTPRFVSRQTGAAELEISPETWDRWVADGRLPPAAVGFPPSCPRWRWADVDNKMAGRKTEAGDAYVAAVVGLGDGAKKDHRRDAA